MGRARIIGNTTSKVSIYSCPVEYRLQSVAMRFSVTKISLYPPHQSNPLRSSDAERRLAATQFARALLYYTLCFVQTFVPPQLRYLCTSLCTSSVTCARYLCTLSRWEHQADVFTILTYNKGHNYPLCVGAILSQNEASDNCRPHQVSIVILEGNHVRMKIVR